MIIHTYHHHRKCTNKPVKRFQMKLNRCRDVQHTGQQITQTRGTQRIVSVHQSKNQAILLNQILHCSLSYTCILQLSCSHWCGDACIETHVLCPLFVLPAASVVATIPFSWFHLKSFLQACCALFPYVLHALYKALPTYLEQLPVARKHQWQSYHDSTHKWASNRAVWQTTEFKMYPTM